MIKSFVFTSVLVSAFFVNADTDISLQERIVADVAKVQKVRSERLKIQLRMDELRVMIAGTSEPKKKAALQREMDMLEKKRKKLHD